MVIISVIVSRRQNGISRQPKGFWSVGKRRGGVEREKERKEWERGKRGESFTVKRFHNKIL